MSVSRDELISIIRSLIGDSELDCVETCADDGSSCHYCGRPLKQIGLHTSKIDHEKDCPYLRAREVIATLN